MKTFPFEKEPYQQIYNLRILKLSKNSLYIRIPPKPPCLSKKIDVLPLFFREMSVFPRPVFWLPKILFFLFYSTSHLHMVAFEVPATDQRILVILVMGIPSFDPDDLLGEIWPNQKKKGRRFFVPLPGLQSLQMLGLFLGDSY